MGAQILVSLMLTAEKDASGAYWVCADLGERGKAKVEHGPYDTADEARRVYAQLLLHMADGIVAKYANTPGDGAPGTAREAPSSAVEPASAGVQARPKTGRVH